MAKGAPVSATRHAFQRCAACVISILSVAGLRELSAQGDQQKRQDLVAGGLRHVQHQRRGGDGQEQGTGGYGGDATLSPGRAPYKRHPSGQSRIRSPELTSAHRADGRTHRHARSRRPESQSSDTARSVSSTYAPAGIGMDRKRALLRNFANSLEVANLLQIYFNQQNCL